MSDRERALNALDNLRNWETRPDLRELLADLVLEFAAQQVERRCCKDCLKNKCAEKQHAKTLRAQIGKVDA